MKQESLYPTYYKLAKWISGYSDASTALVAGRWNIPKEQWLHDWSFIKCGIALVDDELENGTPVDGDACAVRLKQLIALNVHDQLQMLLEETAQRELLLKGIYAARSGIPTSTESFDILKLETLFAQEVFYYAMSDFLDSLLIQCKHRSHLCTKPVPNNAKAIAMAQYLEIPELRGNPELLGCLSATMCTVDMTVPPRMERTALAILITSVIAGKSVLLANDIANGPHVAFGVSSKLSSIMDAWAVEELISTLFYWRSEMTSLAKDL